MANIKISELPQVSTLSNSDIIPAVASSTTSKITLKNLANTIPQVSSSISSSYASTASVLLGSVVSASYAATASWALNFITSSVTSASFATTASYFITSSVTNSTSASYAATASYFITSSVTSASFATTASYIATASWAISASWAPSSPGVATIPSYIATGSVTASVNVGTTTFNLVSSSNNLLTVLSNGNVGIGTTTPTVKLDVSGSSIFRKTVTLANPEPILNITGSFNTSGEATALNIDVFNLNSSTASLLDIKENGVSLFKVVAGMSTISNLQLDVNNNVHINGSGPYLYINDTDAASRGYFLGANDNVFSITNDDDPYTAEGIFLNGGDLYVTNTITASGNLVSANGGIRTQGLDGGPQWKLGDATTGTVTPDKYITIQINGQVYSIPALLGAP